MRDYLNSAEKNQFMVLQSMVQILQGIKNNGLDGPKLGNILEQWSKRGNITKDEHRSLKTAKTYFEKFLNSVFERLNPKEQEILRKKLSKFDFKLIDDYTLKQVYRDVSNRHVNAAVPREQFEDWTCELMSVKCNGCTMQSSQCKLHDVFEDNFIPDSSYNLPNCKYAYTNH